MAKGVFLQMLKQITSSRDSRIRSLGLYWKQELQSREAVHFHLLLWGVVPESRPFVHHWLASRWNRLVCRWTDEEGTAAHLAVHLHPTNFQEVRNMAGYFTKYLGKDDDAVLAGDPIPGRWWGRVNADCIPWAEKSVVRNPPARFRVICHRVARKLRQKRADAAKHAAIMRKAGLVHASGPEKGKPIHSQFQLECGPRRAALRPFIEHFTETRLGPYRFPGPMKTGSIVLVGEFAPDTAKQILTYAMQEFLEFREVNPF